MRLYLTPVSKEDASRFINRGMSATGVRKPCFPSPGGLAAKQARPLESSMVNGRKYRLLGILAVFIFLLILSHSTPLAAEDFLVEGEIKVEETQERSPLPRFDLLAKKLSPSVVNISVEGGDKSEEEQSQNKRFPFFKNYPYRSLGSGFIVTDTGYIVTNYHVIEKADKIIVRLLDDKEDYTAKLIGVDEKTDLALIKIAVGRKLEPARIGDSDDLEVGEWVLAIGNQFQLGQTVTAGIVSAKSRKVPAKISGPYDDFIQTDASINPGSSGGPLFNTKGQVIGINTAIFSPGRSQFGGTGFNIGIGFAVPMNLARNVLNQLKENGKVTRGLLGVVIQSIDRDLAEALGKVKPAGALVADVMPDSPAALAGFRVKDIIISYGGRPVEDHDDLPLMVANTIVGNTIPVEVVRGGKTITLSPRIVELTDSSFVKTKEIEQPEVNSLGLALQDVTDEIAQSLGLESSDGVIVSSVEAGSSAEEGGILRGDIIEEFGNRSVKDLEGFNNLLKRAKKGSPVLVLVRRKEGTRFLAVKMK